MASPALPIINPFDTAEADSRYQNYYEEGNVLRVSVCFSSAQGDFFYFQQLFYHN
jgi:hypothetical protein